MRRPAKGATTHPGVARPGMGYGRPIRPRPGPVEQRELAAELAAFLRGDLVGADDCDRSSVTSSEAAQLID